MKTAFSVDEDVRLSRKNVERVVWRTPGNLNSQRTVPSNFWMWSVDKNR